MIGEQYKQLVQTYWAGRTPREKLLVVGAGTAIGIILFFQLYWRPIHSSIDRLREDISREQGQLAEMRIQAKQMTGYRSSPSPLSLMPTLEKSLENHGLSSSVDSLEPDNNDRALIRLKQVTYLDLIKWLVNLNRQFGIRVKDAKLTSTDNSGIIDASLTLSAKS